MTLPRFTVIGYYLDNHQVYASHFEAEDWEGAIEACRNEISATIRVTAVLYGKAEVADDLDETVDVDPVQHSCETCGCDTDEPSVTCDGCEEGENDE